MRLYEHDVPQMYILALFYKDEHGIDRCSRYTCVSVEMSGNKKSITFTQEFGGERTVSTNLFDSIWLFPYPLGDNERPAVKLK